MKHRRDIQIEGMDLTVFVHTGDDTVSGRVHAPLFPDVVEISVASTFSTEPNEPHRIDSIAETFARFAWQKELEPFYRQCVQDQKAGLPMDRINVFYRRHPELREAA
jgi:hypothetical protein